MALNGYIYGSFSGVSTSWARPVIYWSATQNIGTNSSTITASLRYYKYITGVRSYNLDAPTTSINIGGNTTSSAQDIDLRPVAVNGYTTVWSRTRTITHGSDGSLSVTISASGSTGTSLGNITGLSGNAVLNNIPRASVLTRFTLGSQLEYNVENTISANVDIKYSGFYHRLRLEHTDGTLIWQSDTVYSSSSYTITATQVNTILNKIPSSKSATVRLRLYTYSNSARTAQVGNTSTSSNRTWTVNANQAPSMLETPPVNNRASIYSGFMQHQSKASFSFTATAKYGTSIASYKTVLKYPNGSTQTWNARTATSGILTQTGTHTVTYTATDRRGYSTSSSNTFSVVAYTYPKIASFTVQRNRSTPTTINVYRSVSGIGYSITKTVQVRYRKTGASSWETLNTQNFTASSYSGSLTLTNTDLRSSYEFELVLTDGYGQKATATRTVGTDSVFIHYDRDIGLGIGKYRENGALDVSGDIHANGGRVLDGLATYNTNQSPDTTLETLLLSSAQPSPDGSGFWFYITTFYSSRTTTSNRSQIAIKYGNTAGFAWRAYSGGSWTSWSIGGTSSVAWSAVTGKPAQATRWPSWSEITSKPDVIDSSGSNPNGRYIRFSDGTQICYRTSMALPYASSLALRGDWTFPASFNSASTITALAGFDEIEPGRRGKMTIFTRNATTTTVEVLAASDEALFDSSSTQYVKLIAIGWWK